MNPRPFLACIAIVAGTALAPAAPAAPNQLTAAEKSAGWTLLFDGKTTNGWRVYNKKGAAINGWTVVDGTLHCQSKVKGDNIITEKQFNDFELAWEWKLLPTGNNGVKYFVTEARPKSPGPEYQMIDDVGHPDGKLGPDRQTASFYEVLPPAADKPLRKPGEWNESKIVVRGKKVEMGSDAVKAGILDSKFKNEPGFGDKIVGHIMLTYHQDDCWYRNIKIREIK
jgi:hypothetical protein